MRYLILLLLCAQLLGCMDIATTGAQALYNRRSIQRNLTDQYITVQAYQALDRQPRQFTNANISIATLNNEVVLTGQVPNAWQKMLAGRIVKNVPYVSEVHNLLMVQSPSSTLTRVSDAWITTKVKSKLMASEEVDSSQIKVLTENGTVYLLGIVPPAEAKAAIDIARHTDGVMNVVKVFSYIRITKHEVLT